MKRIVVYILLLSLMLTGCSGLLDGSYVFVDTHPMGTVQSEQIEAVSNYTGLLSTLQELVESGAENGIISMARYDQEKVEPHMERAVEYLLHTDPIGAYALSEITYDLGTSAGQPAVSVHISYLHDRNELKKIQRPEDWTEAEAVITDALINCEAGVVLYVENFREMDFAQWASSYATAHPDLVMELPEVTANLYPESGSNRVIELKFAYQNSRDSLRAMQKTVTRLFSASAIYADSESGQQDQFFKLYSFLMGLSPNFKIETSITPAYSLLQHGVGDSRAFATVYAAMSIQAELECYTVTGTKDGEPWYWNIIGCDGMYYHLDLLECHENDQFTLWLDEEMRGYVWDYSGYPACVAPEEPPVELPEDGQTEQTETEPPEE